MRGRGAGVLVLLAGLVALVFPASGLAASAWRLGHSPAAIANGATATISLTIANQGGPDGNDDLGCVTIDIPSVFDVRSSTVTAAPPGTIWTASASGSTTVRVRASNGGDRLDADASNQSVSVDIGVRGTIAGRYTWVADAWVSQDCSDGFDDPIAFQITINAKVVATPVPTPPPTPTPAPTPTPVPTPNVTPVPTALPPTPTPTPTATLAPGPTATAQPTPTPPPGAGGSVTPPSPSSGAGSSTRPSAEPTPAPALAGAAGNGTAGPDSSPPGAGLLMPGMDPSTGHSSVDGPAIDLTGAMLTPFDEMFEWAVPTLVLSVPGLLVVAAVLVQMLGALAWLPLVRRRLGGFGFLGERPNPIGPGRSTRR